MRLLLVSISRRSRTSAVTSPAVTARIDLSADSERDHPAGEAMANIAAKRSSLADHYDP